MIRFRRRGGEIGEQGSIASPSSSVIPDNIVGRHEDPRDDRTVNHANLSALTPGFQEDHRYNVLGILGRVNQPECMTEDPVPVSIEEHTKCFAPSLGTSREKLRIRRRAIFVHTL